ncbi:MAG: hypothetical protein QM655_12605 [Nocardioidaceae bacterium]
MGRLGGRSTLLAVEGIDYSDDVSRALITAAGSEQEAWGPRPLGKVRRHVLDLITPQDTGSSSLWRLAWLRDGEWVEFHLAPHGNSVASDAEPHYTGTALVAFPDGDFLGGQADPSIRRVLTVELSWLIDGEVTELTTGDYPGIVPAGW